MNTDWRGVNGGVLPNDGHDCGSGCTEVIVQRYLYRGGCTEVIVQRYLYRGGCTGMIVKKYVLRRSYP